MLNRASKTWFVSLEHLLQEGGAPLRRADSLILDTDQCVQPYSPLTISLESFCIFKQLDRRTHGNDLLVRSWTTFGEEPPVEIIHFFEKNVNKGEPKDNLAVEHMFVSDSYMHQNIEIDLQILDVDGTDSLVQDIQSVAHLLGAVFPAVLPFTSVASSLYSNLKRVFRNPHDLAFSGSIKLYDKQLSQQSKQLIPLRCGAYILFNQEVQGQKYKLRELKLEAVHHDSGFIFDDYMVFKVVPKVINSLNSEDLLANQRLAASLLKKDDTSFDVPSNILGKNSALIDPFTLLSRAAKKARLIDHLTEYRKLKRLQRVKSNLQVSRKEELAQEERLMHLAQIIRDTFLEKG